MEGLWNDVFAALRGLVRRPAFAVLASITLALGIGATTAAFSLLNAVVLRSLPFPEPDRLVTMSSTGLTRDNVDDWRTAIPAAERMETYTLGRVVLTGRGPAAELRTMPVSAGFFDVLGASLRAGRFLSADEYTPDAPAAAVISHRLWSTTLGAETDAVGATIVLDGVAWTVVGVLNADFDPVRYRDIDVFIPAARASRPSVSAIVRLAPGASVAQLSRQAETIAARIAAGDERMERVNAYLFSDLYAGEFRAPLTIAFAAAAIVLLIACANVAGLLFARSTQRVSELAVRTALGASRGRIVRQLLAESGVLATAGVTGGSVLAWWAIDALPRIAPPFGPRLDQVHFDPAVLAFAVGAAAITTVIAGLAPALAGARAAARVATSATRATSTPRVRRVREALIVAEIALALLLVIGSSLLVRSFLVLRPASPGFITEDRITARFDIPGAGFVDESRIPFMRELLDKLRSMPGSPAVAAVTDLPLTGVSVVIPASRVDDNSFDAGNRPPMIHFRAATPGYFDVVGMRTIAGRNIDDGDRNGGPAVIVVNETTARRLWPDADPIGRTVAFDDIAPGLAFTVIGVAADTRSSGGTTRAAAEVFTSWWQAPIGSVRFVIHDRVHALSEQDLRLAVADVLPDRPLNDFITFDRIARESVSMPRFQMILMLLSASLALALALVGCYAALAFNVAQRIREFGVRLALGAAPQQILRGVLRRGAMLIAAGLVTGCIGALAASRVLASLLFDVVPANDPITFLVAAAALGAISVLAAVIPAHRAASVAPQAALRSD